MNTFLLSKNVLLLIGSGVLTFTLLYVLLHTPIAVFFKDKPDPRKIHHLPIPRLGGVVMILSFLISLSLLLFVHPAAKLFSVALLSMLEPIVVASALILLVGFFDDTSFVNVRVRHKLGIEIAVAFLAVYIFSVNFGAISILGFGTLPFWLSNMISFLWIIGLANAFNLIDGLDGLAGTISLIALVTLTAIALLFGQVFIAFITLLLAFSTAGFLILNVPPAKTFMGDTGAVFLGTMIALLTMQICRLCIPEKAILVAPLIAAIPILEVAVTMVRRFCKARDRKRTVVSSLHSMVVPDNLHIHHRLIYKGFTAGQSVSIIAILAATLSLAAIAIVAAGVNVALPIFLYCAIPVSFLLYQLDFGGRFSKALHLSPTRYNGLVKPSLIGIIDGEGSFTKRLVQKNVGGVSYIKITESELPSVYQHLRAAVVRETAIDPNPNSLIKKAEQLSSLLKGPVYLINDTATSAFHVREVSKNGSLVIHEKIDSMNNILKDFKKLSHISRLNHHTNTILQEVKADN